MYDYREVRAIKEGILINKEYYEFLHSYKENQELKEKLEKNKITKKQMPIYHYTKKDQISSEIWSCLLLRSNNPVKVQYVS